MIRPTPAAFIARKRSRAEIGRAFDAITTTLLRSIQCLVARTDEVIETQVVPTATGDAQAYGYGQGARGSLERLTAYVVSDALGDGHDSLVVR